MHFVYMLKREDNKWYVGYTSNLDKCVREHKNRWQISVKLVYYESYDTEAVARERERRLKYHGSAWRALIKRINA